MKYITILFVLLFGLAGCDSLKLLKGSSIGCPQTIERVLAPGLIATQVINACSEEDYARQIDELNLAILEERREHTELVDPKSVRRFKCLYVSSGETYAFFDVQRKYWDGLVYRGGVVPVLSEKDGYAKVVVKQESGQHQVRYVSTEFLRKKAEETDDYFLCGVMSAVSLDPDICPGMDLERWYAMMRDAKHCRWFARDGWALLLPN